MMIKHKTTIESAPQASRNTSKRRTKKPRPRTILPVQDRPSLDRLRLEGVVEFGLLLETSVLYVRTRSQAYVFHVSDLPERRIDSYMIQIAVGLIDGGRRIFEAARDLGVSEPRLRQALIDAGYQRVSSVQPRGPIARGRLLVMARNP